MLQLVSKQSPNRKYVDDQSSLPTRTLGPKGVECDIPHYLEKRHLTSLRKDKLSMIKYSVGSLNSQDEFCVKDACLKPKGTFA